MPSPGGTSHKPQIAITLKKNADGSFGTAEQYVERIGGRHGRAILWVIHNPTITAVNVKIHDFTPSNPCPVEGIDFTQCLAQKPAAPGTTTRFPARINKNAPAGVYTYAIYVEDAVTHQGNRIDPELQIDGGGMMGYLSQPIVVVIVVALVALGLWWALS